MRYLKIKWGLHLLIKNSQLTAFSEPFNPYVIQLKWNHTRSEVSSYLALDWLPVYWCTVASCTRQRAVKIQERVNISWHSFSTCRKTVEKVRASWKAPSTQTPKPMSTHAAHTLYKSQTQCLPPHMQMSQRTSLPWLAPGPFADQDTVFNVCICILTK